MNKLRRKFGKRMKYNYKRTFFGLFIFLLLLSLGIGYSYLTTSLSIDGISNVSSAKWDIHFENVEVDAGSVEADTPEITNDTTVSFNAVLENPGDKYEFTVDVVNEGTLDALLDDFSIAPRLTDEQKGYYEYTVSYYDGSEIAKNDSLNAGERKKLLIVFKYKDDENNEPLQSDQDFPCTVDLIYKQGSGKPDLEAPVIEQSLLMGGNKLVSINYLADCNTHTCSYVKNGVEFTTTDTVTLVNYDSSGEIVATVSDGDDTKSSSQSIKFIRLYVKSDGNDSTGYGTINEPYASISRAYINAEDTATIYVMDNIILDSQVNIENNKDITIDSCTKSSDSVCEYDTSNSVTRSNSYTGDFFDMSGGKLQLNNIIINGNDVSTNTAMINVFNGNLDVNNGSVISGGNSTQGGGAIYSEGSTVNINGGEIINNKAASGGALFISKESNANMNGGKISSNQADSGGGIFVHNNSTMTLFNGNVSDNYCNQNGGGLFINDNSVLNVKGNEASIINNTAAGTGGGVFNNICIVNMEKGAISSNKSADGGGGIWNNSGTINLLGGIMDQNEVTGSACGGGAISNDGDLNIDGVTISGNSAPNHNGGAIWSSGGKITMTSGLITSNWAESGGAITLTGFHQNNISMDFSGGTISNNNAKSGNGGGISTVAYSGFEPPILNISEDATISGNTASTSGGGVRNAGTLIMNGGTISNNNATNGGGISNAGGASLTLQMGDIIGNNTTSTGGGIWSAGPLRIMSGTVISDNNTNGNGGGGIWCTYSGSNVCKLDMTGGVVSNNKASQGGGIGFSSPNDSVTHTISGNSTLISENTASIDGGGIYILNSPVTVNFSNGSIYKNTATNSGGGIFINAGTFKMNSGSISNNKATTLYGGGVRVQTAGSFILKDGSIKNNTAKTDGGISATTSNYTRNGGYVCKNNSPTNSFDITAASNSNCS